MQKLTFISISIIIALILTSCESNVHYKKYQKTNKLEWQKSQTFSFKTDINNADTTYNIFIPFRFAEGFPYKVMDFNVQITDPSGNKTDITTAVTIINDNKEYIGDGSGDIWDTEAKLLSKYKFTKKGTYQFDISHIKKHEVVPFVMEVGLRIDYAQ